MHYFLKQFAESTPCAISENSLLGTMTETKSIEGADQD